MKDAKKKYFIPEREIIFRRARAKNYLLEKCEYIPCHKPFESCNMCYCIFYPCEDESLGKWKTSKNGKSIWSCMECSWIHREKTMDLLRMFYESELKINNEIKSVSAKSLYLKFREFVVGDQK